MAGFPLLGCAVGLKQVQYPDARRGGVAVTALGAEEEVPTPRPALLGRPWRPRLPASPTSPGAFSETRPEKGNDPGAPGAEGGAAGFGPRMSSGPSQDDNTLPQAGKGQVRRTGAPGGASAWPCLGGAVGPSLLAAGKLAALAPPASHWGPGNALAGGWRSRQIPRASGQMLSVRKEHQPLLLF